MTKLADTVELMNSEDYKERFKAEYLQTKIRYDSLHKLIIKHDAGTLGFELNCPVELLQQQANNMGNYLYILEVRAQLEDIDLEV